MADKRQSPAFRWGCQAAWTSRQGTLTDYTELEEFAEHVWRALWLLWRKEACLVQVPRSAPSRDALRAALRAKSFLHDGTARLLTPGHGSGVDR
eukprot:364965-Chlamydomonas_euryale.AAC.30